MRSNSTSRAEIDTRKDQRYGSRMECPERRSLFRKYAVGVQSYAEAVRRLHSVATAAMREEWRSAWELAERARKMADDALGHLKNHTAKHKC